ncbi:MAG: ABC transporter ATP-binding protein [Nocardiopsaceae bacterium]|nr:ABC transporter ATP-binding protein [Nocardiopsaceae bacterium]
MSSGEVVLRAESVSKTFRAGRGFFRGGGLHAVSGFSLDLVRERVVALVGESGSGKSTAARLLAGLYAPTSGAITLAGRRVSVRAPGARRRYASHVQIVLQDPFSSLNASYSIRHHLARPLLLHGNAGSGKRADVEARSAALLEEVSLTPGRDFLDRYPHELSGGQRQRVSIARALAVRPEVMLADEPVSMLDVSIRLGILRLLGRLTAERRLALLYITHDIASARYFATEIAVMYAGEMVEYGPSEDVTQAPLHPYSRLLVSTVPDPDRAAGRGSDTLVRGEPPDLTRRLAGCTFAPRCPFAMDRCRQQAPPRFEPSGGHWVRCWLFDEQEA